MHATRPLVQIFGLTFDLSIILTSTFAAVLVLLIVFISTRHITTKKPGKLQNLMEWVIEFIQNIMVNSMGHKDNFFVLAGGVGLILYLVISNLLGVPFSITAGTDHAVWWKSPTADAPPVKKSVKTTKKDISEWPAIEPDISDIREAVRMFSADLPTGINRTILIKDDYSIDFEQLAPYLGGIPTKPYYMSKVTYTIFEQHEKNIPPIIDKVQKSVHLFYRVNKKYPLRPFDPLYRVNYHQLLQGHYLDEMPPIDLYFTDYDGLITNRKPEKKMAGG